MIGRMGKRGFSLVEVILSIVVLASSFLGLSHVLSNTTIHNIDLDISTTAIFLARGKMAETTAKPFDDIDSVATTGYIGNYSDYSYAIAVDFVTAADLNNVVVGPTDYKRIVVTVTHSNWSGNIEVYDLKTDS